MAAVNLAKKMSLLKMKVDWSPLFGLQSGTIKEGYHLVTKFIFDDNSAVMCDNYRKFEQKRV